MYRRYFWNLGRRHSLAKVRLHLARTALEKFREDGSAQWFPALHKYLVWRNRSSEFSKWGMIGFGFENDLGLTPEEYARFELAYRALGKQ